MKPIFIVIIEVPLSFIVIFYLIEHSKLKEIITFDSKSDI